MCTCTCIYISYSLAAEKVLRSTRYEFDGSSFEVSRPRATSAKPKTKANENAEADKTVFVNFTETPLDEDELELWLEDNSYEIDEIENDEVNKRFVVKFKDNKGPLKYAQTFIAALIVIEKFLYSDAERLMTLKSAKIYDCSVTFSRPPPDSDVTEDFDDETALRSIVVRGFDGPPKEDFVRMLFKNAKKSGGGEIETLNVSKDQKSVFITYKDEQGEPD